MVERFQEDFLQKIIGFHFGSGFLTLVVDATTTDMAPNAMWAEGVTLLGSNGKSYPLVSTLNRQASSAIITPPMLKYDVFTANPIYQVNSTLSPVPGTETMYTVEQRQVVFVNLSRFPSPTCQLYIPPFQAVVNAQKWWTAYPTYQTDGVTLAAPHDQFLYTSYGLSVFNQQAAVNYSGSLTNFIDAQIFALQSDAVSYAASRPGEGPWDIINEYVGTRLTTASVSYAIGTYKSDMFKGGVFQFPIPPTNQDTWPQTPVGYEPYPTNKNADLNLAYGNNKEGAFGPIVKTIKILPSSLIIVPPT